MKKINCALIFAIVAFCASIGIAEAKKCARTPWMSSGNCSSETSKACQKNKTVKCASSYRPTSTDSYTCASSSATQVWAVEKNYLCVDVADTNKHCTEQEIDGCIKKQKYSCKTEIGAATCYIYNIWGDQVGSEPVDLCTLEGGDAPAWEGKYKKAVEG